MKIIDAHNHPNLDYNSEKFIENMDELAIQQTWLLNFECCNGEFINRENKFMTDPTIGFSDGPIPFAASIPYVLENPERFILGYCPDPQRKDAVDKLNEAYEKYNIKVCGELKARMQYDAPESITLFKEAGKLKLPVVLHLQYDVKNNNSTEMTEWYGGTIESLINLLDACPDTKFIGHAPGFWAHISNDNLWNKYVYPPVTAPVVSGGKIMQLLRRYPNLYCDISAGSGHTALSRDLSFTYDFLCEFHDRIVYGRDQMDNRHQILLNSLNLPTEILEDIYFRNAEKLIL